MNKLDAHVLLRKQILIQLGDLRYRTSFVFQIKAAQIPQVANLNVYLNFYFENIRGSTPHNLDLMQAMTFISFVLVNT